MKHYLSLGAGVQNSTLALLAAAGGYGPMPEAAIFADTGDEPASVYAWLDWLEKNVPYPIHRVSIGAKLSDLATEVRLSKKSGNTYVKLGIPCYTVGRPMTEEEAAAKLAIAEIEKGYPLSGGEKHAVLNATAKKGMGMRQCTRSAKIEPIRRKLRELAKGENVVQWIGISTDEAHRMKPSRDKWCENIWPLIDLNMTRADCLRWMEDAGWPKPPRSACVYCPYHSDTEWLRLKTEEPVEFAAAVEFEQRLQTSYAAATALHSTPWLHSSRRPLAEVEFKPNVKEPSLFGNECEGMCGV
jgi:hypothetical protein